MSASVTSATWTETKTCSCGYDGPVTVVEVRGPSYREFQAWACSGCGSYHRSPIPVPQEPVREQQRCASCQLSLAVWAYGTQRVFCHDCGEEPF